ncbi:MAG: FctA domain-containing protein [Firmicutes bacterium]|nr:FctA domain-containing protein [Bacillota bacterium]
MVLNGRVWEKTDKDYYLTHPNTGYDVEPTVGYDYVDSYYDANNAAAVTKVFKEIVSNIAISVPQIPTEIRGSDPMTDGYIIYTDPIGEYMEVKDVKAVIYAGSTFTAKNCVENGNKTSYTFTGEVGSPVYGNQDIKNILITVEEDGGKQTLVIKIPASVIPLRVNEVMLNSDGTVKTHTNNGAFPARVIYSVGMKSEIIKQADDGTVYIDKSKLSADYLDSNTNSDGTINFYSNEYTNSHLISGSTAGDTTAEFEPSHTNSFYYFLEDTPIYRDAELSQQISSGAGLDDDTVYYYRDKYYHGNTVEVSAIDSTGAQLKAAEFKTGSDGCLYIAAGSIRSDRILKFDGTKATNSTQTAEDFYAHKFQYISACEGKFIGYLGNNGLLTVAAGGELKICKTVKAADGLTAPDKTFDFAIDLDGNGDFSGTYEYVIVDETGAEVGVGTVSAGNATISLNDGQTATIFNLPPDTAYTVSELPSDGFTEESDGVTGTIKAGKTSVASFTNTYNVEPVVWPANNELSGKKVLVGREWTENDFFTFVITPDNYAPLPGNYDKDSGVTVIMPDTESGQTATFDFGTIRFTAPGEYSYTISEKEPENNKMLPGMSYSGAVYHVAVTVEDNGDGTLKIASSDIQRLYDDNANPLFTYDGDGQIVMNSGEEGQDKIEFTNTYSAEAVTFVPVAFKDYTDNSGYNPLVSGMFDFKLEAVGVVENGLVKENSVSGVPMPEGSKNGAVVTSNNGHNVTFPSITFTQDDIPDGANTVTFRYRMSEVAPSTPANGMTYDASVYTVDVNVSIDPCSSILNVSSVYSGSEQVLTFRNEYTPISAFADIHGSKTLIGRDMKRGESFEFVLGYDTATADAISEGIVVVPDDTATVTGAKDGIASPFVFENIEFKKAGTYVFDVSETEGDASAVDYDSSVNTVAVVVDDADRDGKLDVISVTYGNGASAAEFVNTYTSEFSGDPISLRGTKSLTGKSLLSGEFYFNIEEHFNGSEVAKRLVTHTADTSAENGVYSGRIVFLDNVTYDEPGIYEYYISELIPESKVGGTDYDESKYRFAVTVEDDLNGRLAVTSAVLEKANGSEWKTADAVEFCNTYAPKPTTASLPLINKIIDGDRSEPLKAGEFEFEMKVVSADPADGIILPSETVVSNAANGNILFDEITFTKAGTYMVSVQEIVPNQADRVAGITYAGQTITALYSVVDNRSGVLTATLTQFIGGESIINLYTAKPADVTIDIVKNFIGRKNNEWLPTDIFDFAVKAADSDTSAAIENGDIEFTSDGTGSDAAGLTVTSEDNIASAGVKVNKPGRYTFVVSEIDGGIKGVTYDNSEKEIVIVATDDSANAQIKVNVNGRDVNNVSVDFTNEYKAEATDPISITAKKKVTATEGNTYALKGGEFRFIIEGTQGAPMPEITTAENDVNGNVNFGSIQFTERGNYAYTVCEVQADMSGFVYDGEVFTVTVEVTDDYDNGKLVASTKITDKAGKEAEIEFNNKYNPQAASAIIFGAKELKGGHKQLEADEFEFLIKAVTADAPMPANTSVKNTATGTFRFDAISYTMVGTYVYEITEKSLEKAGYTYDDTVYTVAVAVTDDSYGRLHAEVDGIGTDEAPEIIFENSYVPDSVKVVLGSNGQLMKQLEGRELNKDEFVFALLDSDKNEVAEAKNSSDGTFEFTLSFSKAGTYNYTIAEKNNEIAGVDYDKRVYGVEITITDKGGCLEAESVAYTLDGKETEKAVFSNKYEAEQTDITISAVKKLTGRELADGEFEFVLKDKNGNTIASATNAKDGKVVFETIVLTEAGSYTYTVCEQPGTVENVTYDKTEYVVDVTVADEGNGKLAVTAYDIKKAGDDEAVSEIIFENTYTATTTTDTPKTTTSTDEPKTTAPTGATGTTAPTDTPNNPTTGDNDNTWLWFDLMLFGGGAVAALIAYNRKRRIKEN